MEDCRNKTNDSGNHRKEAADERPVSRMDSTDSKSASRLEVLEEESDDHGELKEKTKDSISGANTSSLASTSLRRATTWHTSGASMRRSSTNLARPSVISLAVYPERSALPLETPGGGSVWPQLYATLAVSAGSLMVGFSAAWTAPALVSLQAENSTLPISGVQASWIGSLMPLSALCGGILGGFLIEPVGRRATIAATAVPFLLSYILIACASHVTMLYIGRALTGLGVGVLSLAIPVYLSEVLESQIRGTLAVLPTTVGNLGILVCFLAGTYLQWNHLALVGAAMPIVFCAMMWFVPETPRWYINRGREDEAASALRRVRGSSMDTDKELQAIRRHIIDTRMSRRESLKNLTSPLHLRALAIALALMCFQQFSGINAVIFYTVGIFQAAGSSVNSNLCSIIVGVVNLASTLLANALIDRLGRRILLIISSVMMAASLFTLGAFFYIRTNSEHSETIDELGWLPLVCFIVYVLAFSFGWGPIPWLFLGEGLPSRIRGPAGSMAAGFSWVCTFVVTKTFADMQKAMGAHGVFWMFGGITLAGLLFVVPVLTEMKGRSLEEIERDMMLFKERTSSGDVDINDGGIVIPIGIPPHSSSSSPPLSSCRDSKHQIQNANSETKLATTSSAKNRQKNSTKHNVSPQISYP